MFNKIYLYSAFNIYIQQHAFSFNFNQNYFHSAKIVVQLQPKIVSFNKNVVGPQPKLFSFNRDNYSTSTMRSKLTTYVLL